MTKSEIGNRKLAMALLLLAAILPGCATILKGPESEVTMHMPHETVVYDEQGKQVQVWQREDSSLYIRLSSDTTHRLTLDYHGERIELSPKRYLEWEYVVGDIMFTYLVGLVVDGANSAYFGFHEVAVFFPPVPDNSNRSGALVSSASSSSQATTVPYTQTEPVPHDTSLPEIGLLVTANLGISPQFGNAEYVGLNHFGLGLGGAVKPWFAVFAEYSYNGNIDLTSRRTGLVFAGSARLFTLDARLLPRHGLVLTTGFGLTELAADITELDAPDSGKIDASGPVRPGFDDWIWTAHAGIGVRGRTLGFLLRYDFGLQRFRIAPDITAPFRMVTLEFGLNLGY